MVRHILVEMMIEKYQNNELSLHQVVKDMAKLQGMKDDPTIKELALYRPGKLPDIPHEICEVVYQIGIQHQPENILDINCGIGKLLVPFAGYPITGIELNPYFVKLGKMIYGDIPIYSEDPLTKTYYHKYDLIVSDLLSPVVRIPIHGVSRSNVIPYLKKGLSLLSGDGVFICLVSNLFLRASKYKAVRHEILLKYGLEMVVSFPYTSISRHLRQRSLLVIKKKKTTNEVLLLKSGNRLDRVVELYTKKLGPTITIDQLKEMEQWV